MLAVVYEEKLLKWILWLWAGRWKEEPASACRCDRGRIPDQNAGGFGTVISVNEG